MVDQTSIEATPNGPYIVKNLNSLKNMHKKLDSKEVMALCRCGGSKNKPFCDGTHLKNEFDSRLIKDRSEDKRKDYTGKEITIADNEGVCAHAGFCDSNLPKVFWKFENNERVPNPDAATKDDIISTVEKCPSGALSYKLFGKEYNEQDRTAEIFVSRNGPYVVSGSPDLKDNMNSSPDSKEHYTLCRCGGSKNKPFCDGTHYNIKFNDEKN